MRKQDIKYLNIEKLFDNFFFSRIKLTVLMCLGSTENKKKQQDRSGTTTNASGYDCLTQLI